MRSYRFQRWWWIVAVIFTVIILGTIIAHRRQAGGLRYEGQPAKKFVVDLLSTNLWGKPYVFAQMDPEVAIPGLIEVLERHHGWTYRAYQKLYRAVPAPLRRGLKVPRDYDWAARQAVDLLEDYGPRAKLAIPALISELNPTNQLMIGQVIIALGKIDPDDPRVVNAFWELVQSKANDNYRVETALILAGVSNAPTQLRNELWKLTATRAGERLVPALYKLNERDPTHFDLCFAQLRSPQPLTRAVAAAALGRTRPVQNKTVVALLEATSDPATEVVEAALSPLLSFSRESTVSEDLRGRCVQRVLEKGQDHYRWTALEVLDGMGTSARVNAPAVLALLSHENPRLRARAATSLGQMGVVEPTLLAALERAAQDDWGFVRDAVAQALNQLHQVEAQSLKAPESTASTAPEH